MIDSTSCSTKDYKRLRREKKKIIIKKKRRKENRTTIRLKKLNSKDENLELLTVNYLMGF
jgi:hypothetical protein